MVQNELIFIQLTNVRSYCADVNSMDLHKSCQLSFDTNKFAGIYKNRLRLCAYSKKFQQINYAPNIQQITSVIIV